ncbi:MAG: tetratricopeptide repeat protein [Bacteroidota bacterium]
MKYNRVQFSPLILLFFALVISNVSIAQAPLKQESLLDESEELVYSNPNDALKVGLHLLQGATSNHDKAKLNLLIAQIYKVKGDYSNSLVFLFEADKNKADLPPKLAAEIFVKKADLLRELYLDDQAKKYLAAAENKSLSIKDKDDKASVDALIVLEYVRMNMERQNYKEASKIIQNQNKNFEKAVQNNPELNLKYTIIQGRICSGLGDFNKAQTYFDKALSSLNNSNKKFKYAEIYTLSGLATVYFHKQDHKKAIDALLKALHLAKTLENVYLNAAINRQLSINYLALNDKVNYKLYNTNFLKLNPEVEKKEDETVNNAYNLISQEYADYFDLKRNGYLLKFYGLLLFFVLVVIACFAFWNKFQMKKKRLTEIISYLEITRNNFIISLAEKSDVKEIRDASKKTYIPQETEQALLNKLKRFESSTKFVNNDMSLAVLAGQFETNTKYLSEIINKHYNVNFNTYINKLRINFIVNKLKSDPNFMNYKISYLAEACGFSSHSSFATIFKSVTGIAPITFIEFLKNEKEAINA